MKSLCIMLPCLNEEKTLSAVLVKIDEVLHKNNLRAEILVVDNNSTDTTAEIARLHGARVVHESIPGYGSAVRKGLESAQSDIILYADSDGSYDFSYIPAFLKIIKQGADLVIGSRFHGNLHPKAMPWTHRYIGTPMLTGLINFLYGTDYLDCNGGMRAIKKSVLPALDLRATGMEMASEMLIHAKKAGLKVQYIPMDFYPDKRGGPAHLRTVRDGLRHLSLILRERFTP